MLGTFGQHRTEAHFGHCGADVVGVDQLCVSEGGRFHMAVYIRVSQVYLDMAEASYEATGDPDAVVTGCTMSVAYTHLDVYKRQW